MLSALRAECIRIDGAYITAGDLAKASVEFRALDADLVFSFAPALGAQRTVSSIELQRWASSRGLTDIHPPSACFERPGYALRQSDVIAALRAAIGPGFDDLRVEIVEMCPCSVPAGRLHFELSGASLPPEDHPETPVVWRGRLTTVDGRVYPIWARVRVVAAISVVRAAADLRIRQALRDEDLEVFKTLASPLRFPQPAAVAAYKGKIINISVRRGAVLRPNMAHSPSDVERGSIVRVEVLNGGARLILAARAETAGNRGDLVTLTNPAGAARFRASVSGPGRAEICFPPRPLRPASSDLDLADRGDGSGGGF